MTEKMDHPTCSELLGRHVRGELDEPTDRAVRAHLAGCPECEQERRGLAALVAGAPPRLSPDERDALLEGVWDAVGRRPEPMPASPPQPGRTRRWFERLSPALAAAALVLVVVGVSSLVGGGGDEGGGGSAAREKGTRLDRRLDAGVGSTDGPRFKRAETAFSAVDLVRLGRREPAVAGVAEANPSTAAARETAAGLLAALVSQAPPEVADQVRDCGRATLEAATGPTLPALAQRGTFEDRRVLVMVFVTDGEPGGRLDGYAVRVWAEGTCDVPLHTASGLLPSP
ncbi:MAG TPA: zf-HC2 domain-containing protein [Actinomycetota bacterium]|nr:zf-HC2 domain-containing protein [Actinomycetota bacterium]